MLFNVHYTRKNGYNLLFNKYLLDKLNKKKTRRHSKRQIYMHVNINWNAEQLWPLWAMEIVNRS